MSQDNGAGRCGVPLKACDAFGAAMPERECEASFCGAAKSLPGGPQQHCEARPRHDTKQATAGLSENEIACPVSQIISSNLDAAGTKTDIECFK